MDQTTARTEMEPVEFPGPVKRFVFHNFLGRAVPCTFTYDPRTEIVTINIGAHDHGCEPRPVPVAYEELALTEEAAALLEKKRGEANDPVRQLPGQGGARYG